MGSLARQMERRAAKLKARTPREQLRGRAVNLSPSLGLLMGTCLRYKIQLYLTPPEEFLKDELQELARMFTIMLTALVEDRKKGLLAGPNGDLLVSTLDSALVAIVGMSHDFWYWNPRYCILMDDAMDASVAVSQSCTAISLKKGFKEMAELDAQK